MISISTFFLNSPRMPSQWLVSWMPRCFRHLALDNKSKGRKSEEVQMESNFNMFVRSTFDFMCLFPQLLEYPEEDSINGKSFVKNDQSVEAKMSIW